MEKQVRIETGELFKEVIMNIISYIFESKSIAVKRKDIARKFNMAPEEVTKALSYCEERDLVLKITDDIYEKRLSSKRRVKGKEIVKLKEYTSIEIEEKVRNIEGNFRTAELRQKWKKYDREILYAVIDKLVKENILIYDPKYVNYHVKKEIK